MQIIVKWITITHYWFHSQVLRYGYVESLASDRGFNCTRYQAQHFYHYYRSKQLLDVNVSTVSHLSLSLLSDHLREVNARNIMQSIHYGNITEQKQLNLKTTL